MIDWSISLPDQVVVTGTSSGLGQETARLLLDAGVRVYGVDVAEAAVDLGKSEAFTEVRGSVTEVATWQEVIAALHADAPAGVAWGWKNFLDEDLPVLTPEQTVQNVVPVPDLITYQ